MIRRDFLRTLAASVAGLVVARKVEALPVDECCAECAEFVVTDIDHDNSVVTLDSWRGIPTPDSTWTVDNSGTDAAFTVLRVENGLPVLRYNGMPARADTTFVFRANS